MAAPKRLSDVGLVGATVVSFTREKASFLSSNGLLFWVDFSERKDLQFVSLREGQTAWVYYAKVNGQIVSFLPMNGERLEDLPPIDSVEV